jgi:hypothetical protein
MLTSRRYRSRPWAAPDASVRDIPGSRKIPSAVAILEQQDRQLLERIINRCNSCAITAPRSPTRMEWPSPPTQCRACGHMARCRAIQSIHPRRLNGCASRYRFQYWRPPRNWPAGRLYLAQRSNKGGLAMRSSFSRLKAARDRPHARGVGLETTLASNSASRPCFIRSLPGLTPLTAVRNDPRPIPLVAEQPFPGWRKRPDDRRANSLLAVDALSRRVPSQTRPRAIKKRLTTTPSKSTMVAFDRWPDGSWAIAT